MTKTFAEIIKGIRKAVLGVEVREDIAQGMEYVEQFATTATQKADEAATSASEAKQAKQDTEAAKETAVSAIDTAKSDATTKIETAKSGALTAIGEGKTEGLNALDKKQQEALDAVSGAVNTAQEAAGTATTQAAAATRQATAAASSASAAKASEEAADGSAQNAKTSEEAAAKSAAEAKAATGFDPDNYYNKSEADAKFGTPYTLPAATSATLGGVKLSDDFTADEDGTLHLAGGTAPEPYPVGSIYQTTELTSPASLFGGSWEQIANSRVLMGAPYRGYAGRTVEAGLPNITGTVRHDNNDHGMMTANSGNTSGSFYAGASTAGKLGTYSGTAYELCFDASRSSAVYGRSSTVQPAAYYVYIWHRVA